jgi:K+-transporting ATPase KdpF subunit
MSLENWIGGVLSLGLLLYLCYAVLRPEKF